MKSLLVLMLMLTATLAVAQDPQDPHEWISEELLVVPDSDLFSVDTMNWLFKRYEYDCLRQERTIDWTAITNQQGTPGCNHQWVYADENDVNSTYLRTTLEHNPCGKPIHTIFARICTECGRHEKKYYYVWWEIHFEKSQYMELMDEFYPAKNDKMEKARKEIKLYLDSLYRF